MVKLAQWLFDLVSPFAKQVLVSLGFGFVTYQGVDVAFNYLVSQISAQFTQVPSDILTYAAMSGIFEAMGLILAAISFRLSFTSMTKLVKL